MRIPHGLIEFIRNCPKPTAKLIWDWLQSNSNTVITDELEIAVRKRRDWRPVDER